MDVHVELISLDPNATPVLTGLSLLAQRGEICLTHSMRPIPPPLATGPWHLRDKYDSNMRIIVDRRRRAFIDFHDSWEIDETGYDESNVYFKRSLSLQRLSKERRSKLQPLGLINEVRSDGFDPFEFERTLRLQRPASWRARELAQLVVRLGASWVDRGSRPNMSLLVSPPDPDAPPRVLFMAALWDPEIAAVHAPELVAAFERINSARAECVRLLRRALGSRFTGGLKRSEYSLKFAPDALLPNAAASSKRQYLNQVRAHPICIATTGLHDSIGCKFAEYVGLSRAIVSEPLNYVIPGPFAAGRNFLKFSSADECVANVMRLVDDRDLRAALMQANSCYYRDFMRPDRLADRILRCTAAAPA